MQATCVNGACGTGPVETGVPLATQTSGDCSKDVCDGQGGISTVADATDLPVDASACMVGGCDGMVQTQTPRSLGDPCLGTKFCNASGNCVDCNSYLDCPNKGACLVNTCQTPTCMDNLPNGSETDVDCGGFICAPCGLNKGCHVNTDCSSGNCSNSLCQEAPVNGCTLATATDVTAQTAVTVTFANGNLTYAPPCLKVRTGTVVTFNGSFAFHPLQGGTVVGSLATPATSGPFATVTNTGTTAAFTMSQAGTFPYYCVAHYALGMYGAVFVVP